MVVSYDVHLGPIRLMGKKMNVKSYYLVTPISIDDALRTTVVSHAIFAKAIFAQITSILPVEGINKLKREEKTGQ